MNTAVNSQANESSPVTPRIELAPADFYDPVIEAYKKDVDRTLLRENLKLTVEERLRKAESFHEAVEGWREAGKRARHQQKAGDKP